MFILNQTDAADYLLRDGDLRTFSRYGDRTSDCIEAAYIVALVCALEDGRTTIDADELDAVMSLVVNDDPSVASVLREASDHYGIRHDYDLD